MTPEIKVDDREWKRAANALFQQSSRSCVDFINGQSLRVVIEAVRQTDRADKEKIRQTLEGKARGVRFERIKSGKNKGKFRTVKEQYIDSFAQRILIQRFLKTGSFGIAGRTMPDMVRRFIAARVRSANFIRSGWIPARQKLFQVVKEKPNLPSASFDGAKQYGKPKGSVSPAIYSGLRSIIQCVIENTALLKGKVREPAPGGNPKPTAVRGLQRALDWCARDMTEELARRLNKDLGKFNAR